MLGYLGPTLSFLRYVSTRIVIQSLSSLGLAILISNLHGLIQLILDDLPAGRGFHIIKSNCWLLRGTLRLETLALGLVGVTGIAS